MPKAIWSAQSTSWSLLDQALVSGASFLIGVMLARQLGLAGFGAYVIAQIYLLHANTVQNALVVSPMMTVVPAETDIGAQRRLLRGFCCYMTLVLLATVLIVQVVAWVLGHWWSTLDLGALALPLAAAMASSQVQDWLRRALYVMHASRAVFLSDLLGYGTQLLSIVYLAWQGSLSPDRALWALAFSFALSALCTAALVRLMPDLLAGLIVIRSHWRASRDFLVVSQLQWASTSGVILIGAGFVGTQAAGAIRAAQNLLGPVVVFFQWMDNVIPVRAVEQLRTAGRDALAAYLRRINWIGLVALLSFTLLLLPVDEWLMEAMYGATYRPFAALVVFQALYYLFGHAYRMQSFYNRAIGQTPVLARASLWWAVLTGVCAPFTIGLLAERGIMLALVAGEVTGLVYLLWGRHVASASTHSVEGRYMQWKRGAKLLVLPLANRHVLRGAVGMYSPARVTGRLYRTLLSAVLPMWRLVLAPKSVSPGTWIAHLPRLVKAVSGARIEWVGGLQDVAGLRTKVTLRLMDEYGRALAYGRVAADPSAIALLRREADALSRLASTSVADQVPQLIDHGVLSGLNGYFLLESAGSEQAAGAQLDERHFAFLLSLVTSAPTQPWALLLQHRAEELAPALTEYAVAREALSRLRVLDCPAVAVCIEHGDFAPWNTREQPDGRLFVFDWEYSRPDGLPWFDAMHFRFQQASLVQRQSAKALLQTLRATFAQSCAQRYAARLDTTKQTADPLITLYLLRTLAWGRREGRPTSAYDQVARVQVLHLLEEQ